MLPPCADHLFYPEHHFSSLLRHIASAPVCASLCVASLKRLLPVQGIVPDFLGAILMWPCRLVYACVHVSLGVALCQRLPCKRACMCLRSHLSCRVLLYACCLLACRYEWLCVLGLRDAAGVTAGHAANFASVNFVVLASTAIAAGHCKRRRGAADACRFLGQSGSPACRTQMLCMCFVCGPAWLQRSCSMLLHFCMRPPPVASCKECGWLSAPLRAGRRVVCVCFCRCPHPPVACQLVPP